MEYIIHTIPLFVINETIHLILKIIIKYIYYFTTYIALFFTFDYILLSAKKVRLKKSKLYRRASDLFLATHHYNSTLICTSVR